MPFLKSRQALLLLLIILSVILFYRVGDFIYLQLLILLIPLLILLIPLHSIWVPKSRQQQLSNPVLQILHLDKKLINF